MAFCPRPQTWLTGLMVNHHFRIRVLGVQSDPVPTFGLAPARKHPSCSTPIPPASSLREVEDQLTLPQYPRALSASRRNRGEQAQHDEVRGPFPSVEIVLG
jgi:hypothetical protein